MGILRELWTAELIKHFRHDNAFLSRIPKGNQFVNNNVIHLADIGADPEVLINNTTYPIAVVSRTDTDVAIALDKFDTKNTKITDDELHALPYNKKDSVIEQHKEVLEESTAEKALHALAVSINSANTPLVVTTGTTNGETNARKRLKVDDIVMAKRKLDDLKVPKKGRELVLCPAHVQDLLLTSEAFQKQWYNIKSGEILDMFGFILSEFVAPPLYYDNAGTLTKRAFGAAAVPADDQVASVFYYNKRAVHARGEVVMYLAEAKNDPEYRQTKVGFRLYHICLPKKNTGFGAIVANLVS